MKKLFIDGHFIGNANDRVRRSEERKSISFLVYPAGYIVSVPTYEIKEFSDEHDFVVTTYSGSEVSK